MIYGPLFDGTRLLSPSTLHGAPCNTDPPAAAANFRTRAGFGLPPYSFAGPPPHTMPESPAPTSADVGPNDPSVLPLTAELQRKALHVLALVVPFGMQQLGMPTALYALLPMTAVGLAGDVLRAYSPRVNRFIRRIFGGMMRSHELPPPGQGVVINGATWVLVAASLLAVVFPLRVVVPVFTMFMVSDAVAAVVGRRWGRHHWGNTPRTIEGSAAFLCIGLGVMACFPALAFGIAAAAVGASCIAEALPGPGNDNVRVPFTGALVVVTLEWLLWGVPFSLFPLFASG